MRLGAGEKPTGTTDRGLRSGPPRLSTPNWGWTRESQEQSQLRDPETRHGEQPVAVDLRSTHKYIPTDLKRPTVRRHGFDTGDAGGLSSDRFPLGGCGDRDSSCPLQASEP